MGNIWPFSEVCISLGLGEKVHTSGGFLYLFMISIDVKIVFRYNPKINRWDKVSSMNIKRLGVAVAVLNGYLYAVGGSDGQIPWNLVERYDPKENRWSEVAPMSTRRKHLGCAIYRVCLSQVTFVLFE